MALIACPECARSISTEAKVCPGCGFPIAEGRTPTEALPAGPISALAPADNQTVLMEVQALLVEFRLAPVFLLVAGPAVDRSLPTPLLCDANLRGSGFCAGRILV